MPPTAQVGRPSIQTGGRWIDQVFVKMQAAYGGLWASRLPAPEMTEAGKSEWAKALSVFTRDQILRGFERCFERHSMPPTLPEFMECCKPDPAEFGLPDVEFAYREACRAAHAPGAAKWSHAVVYHTGRQVGWFDLERSEGGTEKRFGKVYQQLCQRAMAGEQFELQRCDGRSLTQHRNGQEVRTVQQKQTAQHWLGQMKQALGG
ncbi:replication protein P [Oceanospirillum beijerinckii]|uniref:replication protein P n=1 Tax=Oceanospirillum beijerinckii TaxID=64976 RepID=UPI00068661D0|nr:replication protein P [Oceanospirillum beijerinckii]